MKLNGGSRFALGELNANSSVHRIQYILPHAKDTKWQAATLLLTSNSQPSTINLHTDLTNLTKASRFALAPVRMANASATSVLSVLRVRQINRRMAAQLENEVRRPCTIFNLLRSLKLGGGSEMLK